MSLALLSPVLVHQALQDRLTLLECKQRALARRLPRLQRRMTAKRVLRWLPVGACEHHGPAAGRAVIDAASTRSCCAVVVTAARSSHAGAIVVGAAWDCSCAAPGAACRRCRVAVPLPRRPPLGDAQRAEHLRLGQRAHPPLVGLRQLLRFCPGRLPPLLVSGCASRHHAAASLQSRRGAMRTGAVYCCSGFEFEKSLNGCARETQRKLAGVVCASQVP